MRIVVWIPVKPYEEAVVPAISDVSGVELVVVHDPAHLPEALSGAEAMISSGASKYSADVATLVAGTPTLRWFQTVAAGNEGFESYGVPPHVTVTSSGGHSAPVVAEHAMSLLLAISHCMPEFVEGKAARQWDRTFTPRFRSMFGKTAVVIGLGRIGQEIARRARAFDMKVIGVNRSGKAHDAVDACYQVSDMHEALTHADAIMLAAPLTSETERLIGAREFSTMKREAYLVNIARGKLIDQEALREALGAGTIAGAAIDVTYPEPLPSDDPLWTVPNLIISPHTAGGGSAESPKRLAAAVRENLERFRAGEPLLHVLNYGANAR